MSILVGEVPKGSGVATSVGVRTGVFSASSVGEGLTKAGEFVGMIPSVCVGTGSVRSWDLHPTNSAIVIRRTSFTKDLVFILVPLQNTHLLQVWWDGYMHLMEKRINSIPHSVRRSW